MRDIEARFAVEEGVVVPELLFEALIVDTGIADAEAVETAEQRKGRQDQTGAEEFLGKRPQKAAGADVRAAARARGNLGIRNRFGQPAALAANITGESRRGRSCP
jgi:hypothetical protein